MPISMNNTTLTFNNGTTMTTAATGTVSSVATGNGLSGGTITSTGTLTVACPTANTVGSYATIGSTAGAVTSSYGGNYSVGTNSNQIQLLSLSVAGDGTVSLDRDTSSISGTWKMLSKNVASNNNFFALGCRVS